MQAGVENGVGPPRDRWHTVDERDQCAFLTSCVLIAVMAMSEWVLAVKTAKTLKRDKRNYSSKTALVAQLAIEFNLEVELKNIILVAFHILSFYTARVKKTTCLPVGLMPALPR